MVEKDILNRISKGDISIFEWLNAQYYVPLCVYASHFTRDRKMAEDIVQDIFLRLWEQRKEVTIYVSLKGYLFSSVRSHCLDYLKHQQIVDKYNEQYTQLLKEAEYLYLISEESGESVMIASELESSVHEAINSLPEQCRKIFIMNRFENLKYHEIAKKLGITLNTVQKQISIALEKLRNKLGKYLT